MTVFLFTIEGFVVSGATLNLSTFGSVPMVWLPLEDRLNGVYMFTVTAGSVSDATGVSIRIEASKYGYATGTALLGTRSSCGSAFGTPNGERCVLGPPDRIVVTGQVTTRRGAEAAIAQVGLSDSGTARAGAAESERPFSLDFENMCFPYPLMFPLRSRLVPTG